MFAILPGACLARTHPSLLALSLSHNSLFHFLWHGGARGEAYKTRAGWWETTGQKAFLSFWLMGSSNSYLAR